MGWQDPLTGSWVTARGRLRRQCQIFLYRLSTRELQSAVIRDCLLTLPDAVPWPRFLAGGAFLHFVAALEDSGAACLRTVRLGAAGRLHADTYSVSTCRLRRRSWAVSASSQGAVAFLQDYGTLCLWRPGYLPRTVKLQHHLLCVLWSPCGAMVLILHRGGVSFVSCQRRVLCAQQLTLHGWDPVWAPQGVLFTRQQPGQCSIDFHAVLPGPTLQLQHRFLLTPDCRLCRHVSLGADHFAIIVAGRAPSSGSLQHQTALYIHRTPAAKPVTSEVPVTQARGLQSLALGLNSGPLKAWSLDGSCYFGVSVSWLPGGSALLCRTPDRDQLIRFH